MSEYFDTKIQTRGDADQAATLEVSASPEEFGNYVVLHAGVQLESSTTLSLTVTEACDLIHALNKAINCLVAAEG